MQKIIEKIIQKTYFCLNKTINNEDIINLYLEIGEILSKDDISYQNWFEIEDGIRKEFGVMVCFSRKNLNLMKKFYLYSKEINYSLYELDWNTYLFLLKMKKYKEYIEIALKNHLNKREVEYYLKNGQIKKIRKNYIDPSLEELQDLQNKLNKNNQNLI